MGKQASTFVCTYSAMAPVRWRLLYLLLLSYLVELVVDHDDLDDLDESGDGGGQVELKHGLGNKKKKEGKHAR